MQALDGLPEFTQKAFHHVPLAVVDAVIAFNKQAESDERFDGIHLDNEPYTLLGWHEPTRRDQILVEFLELNAECQRRVRAAKGLVFGVDIPFWWQELDPHTGKPIGDVTFNGRRKPASFHCIDLLDNVGIMNYRDQADGADGLIAHAQQILAYSERSGGATIFMGIETDLPPPRDVWFVAGLPRKRFEMALRGPARDWSSISRFDDLKLWTLDDGDNVHVGVELPPQPAPDQMERVQRTLQEIAKRFGAVRSGTTKSQVLATRKQAELFVNKDPEWSNFRSRDFSRGDGQPEQTGFMATSVMLPKITFGDNSVKDLLTQTSAAEDVFRNYKNYAGIAIHHFESYRTLNRTGVRASR